jgi:hypothetical protein
LILVEAGICVELDASLAQVEDRRLYVGNLESENRVLVRGEAGHRRYVQGGSADVEDGCQPVV